MELRQLRYFVVLAQELHFGRAAGRIHIAQSALSQQIKKLEGELGTALLTRSTHGVALTETGRVLLEEATKVLQQVRQAETAVIQAENGAYGKLSIGFVESALWDVMPRLIKQFHLRYPQVELVPRHMNTLEQMQALQSGEIQVGLVGARFALPGLQFHSIRQEGCLLAVPAWHPLAKEQQVSLKALSEEPFVAIRRACGPFYFDSFIQLCMDSGFSPRIVLTADEMQPLLAFVASGMGVALIHASARQIRQDLCYLPVQGVQGPRYEILLAWDGRDPSPVLRHFLDEARQVIRQERF